MDKKYLGVGIMDADYPVQPLLPNGKRDRCPYYVIWTNVLSRCFLRQRKHDFLHTKMSLAAKNG